jgi:hypothetical protein
LRRWLGVLLLLILAIGVLVGSRIEPVTVPWDVLYGVVAGGGVLVDSGIAFPVYWRVNLQFVQVWLVVNALIFVLLGLALFDWRATRRYAQRHRQSMARERIEILRKTLQQSDPRRNGHPREPDQDHR